MKEYNKKKKKKAEDTVNIDNVRNLHTNAEVLFRSASRSKLRLTHKYSFVYLLFKSYK